MVSEGAVAYRPKNLSGSEFAERTKTTVGISHASHPPEVTGFTFITPKFPPTLLHLLEANPSPPKSQLLLTQVHLICNIRTLSPPVSTKASFGSVSQFSSATISIQIPSSMFCGLPVILHHLGSEILYEKQCECRQLGRRPAETPRNKNYATSKGTESGGGSHRCYFSHRPEKIKYVSVLRHSSDSDAQL